MSNYSIEIAKGKRNCHPCNIIIKKGDSFLLSEWKSSLYMNYTNSCPKCGIGILEPYIKELTKLLKELKRIEKWDQ